MIRLVYNSNKIKYNDNDNDKLINNIAPKFIRPPTTSNSATDKKPSVC